MAAVVVLTAVAAALRLSGIDQSLFGDELFTYDTVHRGGLGSVLHQVHAVESSPPAYYVLAWAAGRLFDPTVWIRLPSFVFGVATVPLVYALGRRLADRAVALTAAALVAFGPFAIFFSTEARGYSMLTFLVAASTLSLVTALRAGGAWRWALAWFLASAAIYTHYTAVFPLLAQAGWAVWAHRDRMRPLILTYGAVALAYLPWVPEIRGNRAAGAIAGSYDLTAGSAFTAALRTLWGHPIQSLAQLPGTVGLVVLGAAAAALFLALTRVGRDRVRSVLADRDRSRSLVLAAALAAATPIGLLAYLLASGNDLYLPRNLSASLPGLAVVVASLIWLLPRRVAVAATSLALAASVLGLVLLLQPEHERPAFRAIASAIDAQARPADRVVDSPLFFTPTPQLQRGLTVQLKRPHRVFRLVGTRPSGKAFVGVADPRAWRGLRRGDRVFVAGFELEGTFLVPRPPVAAHLRLLSHRSYPGLSPLVLDTYVRVS